MNHKHSNQSFWIGNLDIKVPVIYSPLAGCSDLPMRRINQEYHQGLVFTEMVKMNALVRHDPGTYRLLDYERKTHPIGAQICGTEPKMAADAARIIEDLGYDLVDLNCGCPVDKVTKDGSGSGMLKNPERIGEVLRAMKEAVQIPVTVKIRAGWDDTQRNAPEVTKIAEMAGANAISVHGRTRKQAYQGKADRNIIRECSEAAKDILVIGNGDIFDVESALDMFRTGCDAVLVSRGSIGQPWIGEDIARALQGQDQITRTSQDLRSALIRHFQYILEYQTEKKAVLDMRRVGCWYLKRYDGVKALKEKLNRSKDAKESLRLVETFSWETCSLSPVH